MPQAQRAAAEFAVASPSGRSQSARVLPPLSLMRAYLIRRLLLIPLTLLGVTFLVFGLTRILPGGPMEKAMQAASQAEEGGRSGGRGPSGAGPLSKEQELQLARNYGLARSFLAAYAEWWGIIPREDYHQDFALTPNAEATPPTEESVFLGIRNAAGHLESKPGKVRLISATDAQLTLNDASPATGWHVRFASPTELDILEGRKDASGHAPAAPMDPSQGIISQAKHVVLYQLKYAGVCQWDFRYSLNYNDPVWDMIKSRLPVSCFYGVLTLLLTYGISLPLGILKALRHRTWIDSASSALIFIGYAIPGFAVGAVLLLIFAFRLDWFPIGGFTSDDFASLSFGGKLLDLLQHAALPLGCLMLPAYAETTMLMKNSLMDNLAQDYVRTAVAKGSTYRRAVFAHAVRNSIIPIATTFGQNIILLVSGFLLIEQVFDIQGFGQLTFNALVDRDYPIVMATIFMSSFLLVLGNIISDVLVAVLNPRIRFE